MNPEKSYQETVQDMIDSGTSREEILQYARDNSEHAVDLDNLPSVKHNWVRRGIKLSCEGAGHPSHSHFLFKR